MQAPSCLTIFWELVLLSHGCPCKLTQAPGCRDCTSRHPSELATCSYSRCLRLADQRLAIACFPKSPPTTSQGCWLPPLFAASSGNQNCSYSRCSCHRANGSICHCWLIARCVRSMLWLRPLLHPAMPKHCLRAAQTFGNWKRRETFQRSFLT